MTETSTPDVKKKRSLVLPIAGAIIAVAAVGFVVSRAGLDKALVKQQLDDFIVQMQEKGRAQGRDLNLTYGELEVVGSFASKHVVIHDPSLTVKPLERKPLQPGAKKAIDALVITTPTLEIYPQAKDLSALRVQLPQPINVAAEDAPEKSLLKVTSNVPPVVTVGQKAVGEVKYQAVSYQSPTQMEFTYLREEQAKGDEEKTPSIVPVYETITLAVAQGSGISSDMATDKSGLGEVKVFFRDLVLTPKEAPEGALKLAEITGGWSNSLNDKKLNVIHAALKAGPVTSDNASAPYLPVALDLDATYEGAMPKTPEAVASIQSPESSMVLKNFSLTSKDASLKAVADFKANASDVLPVGTATVSLTNAPFVLAELRKHGVLNDASEPLVNTVLLHVTGSAPEQLKDVVIPVERARGGSFKIGNTTFEELFAVFMKQAIDTKAAQPEEGAHPADQQGAVNPPLVPQLPAADKPKSAPIEVPDHGVRG